MEDARLPLQLGGSGAGLAIDETPIPSKELRTPRIPGEERFWVSVGLTYVAGDNFSFDVGYSHLFVDDANINNVSRSSSGATLVGTYTASVDILSAGVNFNF